MVGILYSFLFRAFGPIFRGEDVSFRGLFRDSISRHVKTGDFGPVFLLAKGGTSGAGARKNSQVTTTLGGHLVCNPLLAILLNGCFWFP